MNYSESGFEFDFFLSRRGAVGADAEFVADVLLEAGFKVFVQDYDFHTGDDFLHKMHIGLTRARHLIVLLTDDYDQSPFTWMEFCNFVSASPPTAGERRLVIFRVAECQPRGLLSSIVFQDLVGVEDKAERKRRILSAANGISAPAPFELISTRLVDGLQSIDRVPDAWQRLMETVPFVGRRAELAALINFASGSDDARPFTWQVLYGPHASGKSRAAREWIVHLSSQSPPWHGGFAPDTTAGLMALLSLRPVAPTAIVVDDAPSHGEALWDFLERGQRWKDQAAPVRVLLVAHTDLAGPVEGSFTRAETVRASRQNRPWNPQQARALFRSRPTARTTLAVSGCYFAALKEVGEQEELMKAAATVAGNTLTDEICKRILETAGGRPAFLLLAGSAPERWPHLLVDYAHSIADEATRLFAPSRDGLKVLAASVLIGPMPDEVRLAIAPNAFPPGKLARLFPERGADTTREIPRFQPDFLGFHVLGAALAVFSEAECRSIGDRLFAFDQARFTAQLSGCFDALKPSYNYYCLLVERQDEASARFAQILDTLIGVVVCDQTHSLKSPSTTLVYKRRDAVLALLDVEVSAEWDQEKLTRLILEALRFVPNDAVVGSIAAAIGASGVRQDRVGQALALVEAFSVPYSGTLRDRLNVATFHARDPRTIEGAVALCSALASEDGFERLYAAYEASDWLGERGNVIKPMLYDRQALLAGLHSMLRRPSDHDRMAAAWCLKMLLRDNSTRLRADGETLAAEDTAFMLDEVECWLRAPRDEAAIDQFVQVVGLSYTRPGSHFASEGWLDAVVDFVAPPWPEPPERVVKTLRRIALASYSAGSSSPYLRHTVARNAAYYIAKLMKFEPEFAELLDASLEQFTWGQIKEDIYCHLASTPSPAARTYLLRHIVHSPDAPSEVPFLCTFALLKGDSQLLADLETIIAQLDLKIDVTSLLAAASARLPGEPWRGVAIDTLRRHLADNHVRQSAHLIHKLKAKDSTGRWAYYFVLVPHSREDEFLSALKSKLSINLEDYGRVVASCYGETPNDEVRQHLKNRYGFIV